MAGTIYAYVANFLGGGEERVLRFAFDPESGALDYVGGLAEGVERPIYLESDPSGRWLLAADCLARWEEGGAIAALEIDPRSGALTFRNARPCGGVIPVFVHVSADSRWVLTASCGPFEPGTEGRTAAVLPLGPDGLGSAVSVVGHDGTSIDPERQSGPHPHSIALDPAQRFALVPDLGADEIRVYRFEGGKLFPHARVSAPRGSGPRHVRFDPEGHFVYLTSEISADVLVYRYDATRGGLVAVQSAPGVPEGFDERAAAELHVHPSGRWLYSSNRHHGSIAVFAIDRGSGRVAPVDHCPTGGELPRGFAIDPDGRHVVIANERSETLETFRIDLRSGRLKPTGRSTHCPGPACVTFVRSG